MTQEEAESAFAAWLSQEGHGDHYVPADGEWHNLPLPDNRPGQKKGSAKLNFGDQIEGLFKDFRKPDVRYWHPAVGAAPDVDDAGLRARTAEAERRKAELWKAQEAARLKGMNLFFAAAGATANHPYLVRKKIAKNLTYLRVTGEDLLIPVHNARTDEFQTIQRIGPDGTKRFPKHAVKVGGYAIYSHASIGAALTKKTDRPIIICEGYATAWAIYQSTLYPVVAALDCGNLEAVAQAIRDRFPLRQIIIAADNDVDPEKPDHNPGIEAAMKVVRGVSFRIKLAVPPPGDFWDLLDTKGEATVKKVIDEAAEPTPEAPSDEAPSPDRVRLKIVVKAGQLAGLASKGEQALVAAGFPIFERGGSLVHPVIREVDAAHGRRTVVAQLKRIDAIYVRDLLSRAADWQRYDGRGKKLVSIDPPNDIALTILGRDGDEWPFPTIKGLISTPTLRPDGTILCQEGYDDATQLLLVSPPKMPTIPGQPTRDDAMAALVKLEDLLTEFPFDDDAAKAVALSAIITPVVRGAFPVAPMHVARAPVAASGKSFLWDVASGIATGQRMPVMSAGPDEAETEKRLGAALLAGQPLVSIDNVNGQLSGSTLCQIIERPSPIALRILGRTEQVQLDARGVTFYATGNNIIIVGDLTRRAITSTLDPKQEQPELRVFTCNPFEKVLADRGAYVAAALTICRAYIVAGRPDPAPKFASFEGWSDTVRSALIWLGKADPIESTNVARAEDPELACLRDMLVTWADVIGIGYGHRVTLTRAVELALDTTATSMGERRPTWPELNAAVRVVARGKDGDVKRDLGYWFRSSKGRVVEGRRFMNRPDKKSAAEWWVEDVNEPTKNEPGKVGSF